MSRFKSRQMTRFTIWLWKRRQNKDSGVASAWPFLRRRVASMRQIARAEERTWRITWTESSQSNISQGAEQGCCSDKQEEIKKIPYKRMPLRWKNINIDLKPIINREKQLKKGFLYARTHLEAVMYRKWGFAIYFSLRIPGNDPQFSSTINCLVYLRRNLLDLSPQLLLDPVPVAWIREWMLNKD